MNSTPRQSPNTAVSLYRVRTAVLSIASVMAAPDGHAADRFEIQVYDGQANAPGVASLEQHVNFTDRGSREPSGPELATNHQLHWTFEGGLGVTRVWEPGFYFQTALLPDGTLAYAGTKLRTKLVAEPLWEGRLRWGVNFELARVPERFERDQWSTEIRPIVALSLPALSAAVNPIFGVPLAHGGYADGPHFEPAASVKGVLSDRAALGFEYYGDVGPVLHAEALREQEHYLYGAGDYVLTPDLDLNLGVGYGFGPAEDLTFKAILGWQIGRVWGR